MPAIPVINTSPAAPVLGQVEGSGTPVPSLTSDIVPLNRDITTAQGDPDNPLSILTEAASSEHALVDVVSVPDGANYLDLWALINGEDDVAVNTNAIVGVYGRVAVPASQSWAPELTIIEDAPAVLTGPRGQGNTAVDTAHRWIPLQEVAADDHPVTLKAVAQRYIYNTGTEAVATTIPNRVICAGCDRIMVLTQTALTLTNGGSNAAAVLIGRFLV